MTAWQHVAGSPALLGRRLVVFAPARAGERDVEALRRLADGTSIRVERFDPDFLEWLAVAELSVSRAGYNTCANLLEVGRRAVLIPDLSMSDQPCGPGVSPPSDWPRCWKTRARKPARRVSSGPSPGRSHGTTWRSTARSGRGG